MNLIKKKFAFKLSYRGTFDSWFIKAKTKSKVNDKSKHIRQLMLEKLKSRDIDDTYISVGDSLYHLVK